MLLALKSVSILFTCFTITSITAQQNVRDRTSDLIKKLRNSILPHIPKTSYVYEFAKHDLYLLRWLQDASYNVNNAEKRLLDHLKWRKAQRMDTIDKEDWTEFRRDYPIFEDTFDKIGSPIGEAWFSEWDVRTAVVTGKARKLDRWVARLGEIQTRRLYGARAAGLGNVTNAVLLWDLEGFNLLQHGCAACTSVYINMAEVYETHYPGLWGAIMLINMNPSFDSILSSMQPFLRPSTKKAMQSFHSRRKWMSQLDKLIDRKQRSIRFGGTKKRAEWD